MKRQEQAACGNPEKQEYVAGQGRTKPPSRRPLTSLTEPAWRATWRLTTRCVKCEWYSQRPRPEPRALPPLCGSQNGAGSLKFPPRSVCRCRPELRSPLPRWELRSTLAVAHFREAPTSSASSSVTDRFSPSGVSQLRCRNRPVTITRSPLPSDSARFSAWPRHTLTLKNEVSPSRHWPSCWSRWGLPPHRLATAQLC